MANNPNTNFKGQFFTAVESGEDWAVSVYPHTIEEIVKLETPEDSEGVSECGFFHTPMSSFSDSNSMLEFLKLESFGVWTNE